MDIFPHSAEKISAHKGDASKRKILGIYNYKNTYH